MPNCARILPTFSSMLPGNEVNVTKPSSMSSPCGPADRKKSARAYGSMTAWNETSASLSSIAGCSLIGFLPAAPTKFAITDVSGLKTFEDPAGTP